ncbi:hypothetical protein RJ639_012064 [Escallonia herrerae]|uniref:rRNA N-glycosylase n=1 Tax=Escallonia herrerae TaxID=1293975 RepID=A0AA88VP36_9ASTE|nr:hypothetical protein RJ639_012064 [Escallonia herrerae]
MSIVMAHNVDLDWLREPENYKVLLTTLREDLKRTDITIDGRTIRFTCSDTENLNQRLNITFTSQDYPNLPLIAIFKMSDIYYMEYKVGDITYELRLQTDEPYIDGSTPLGFRGDYIALEREATDDCNRFRWRVGYHQLVKAIEALIKFEGEEVGSQMRERARAAVVILVMIPEALSVAKELTDCYATRFTPDLMPIIALDDIIVRVDDCVNECFEIWNACERDQSYNKVQCIKFVTSTFEANMKFVVYDDAVVTRIMVLLPENKEEPDPLIGGYIRVWNKVTGYQNGFTIFSTGDVLAWETSFTVQIHCRSALQLLP